MRPHDGDDVGSVEDMAAASFRVAEDRLADAKDLYEIAETKARPGSFSSVVNRAYYAAFSAITALHTIDGRFFRRHGQAIGAFNQFYVRTGIFDASYNRAIERLKELRHTGDYDFSYRISRETAKKSLDVAEHLVDGIKAYCFERYPKVKAAYQIFTS